MKKKRNKKFLKRKKIFKSKFKIKKRKKFKKTKKKSKKIKRVITRIKLKKKVVENFNKQIIRFKKLSFQKIVGFIFKPLIKSFVDYRQKRKIEKLKKIDNASKQKEKEIKLREKLREE